MSQNSDSEALGKVIAWAGAVVLVAALIAAIVYGGHVFGWWLSNDNTKRAFGQTVNSQQYQQSLVDQMQGHLSNIRGLAVNRSSVPAGSPEQATLRAQELAELSDFCGEAGRLTAINPATGELMKVVHANCSAGANVTVPPIANPVPKS